MKREHVQFDEQLNTTTKSSITRVLKAAAKPAVIAALAVVMTASAQTASANDDADAGSFVAGRILLKMRAGHAGARSALPGITSTRPLRPQGAAARNAMQSEWFVADLDDGTSVEDALSALEGFDGVELAQPDFIRTIPTPVTPQNLEAQNDPGRNQQYALERMQVNQAWQIETGNPEVIVAVLDTGVDYSHPDLQNQMFFNPQDPINGVDDDGNGYPDDIGGWNFALNNNNPMDGHSHGTHVAGIIAATQENQIGIAGVANVRIMPLTVLGPDGSGSDSDIAEAIYYAVENGADIINMSLGGPAYNAATDEAVQMAAANNVLVLAASGNESANTISFPAGYEGAVAVGATDQNDQLADFSNIGQGMELVAPGVGILSTVPGDYESLDGTSMATPCVAGVAALLKSAEPTLSAADIRELLSCTADDLGNPGYDTLFGHGRVNALRALTETCTQTGNPGGQDDAHEENDSPEQMVTLQPGSHQLAGLDEDWFSVSLTGAFSIRVDGNGGDLDLHVFDQNGDAIGTSESPSSTEQVDGTANGPVVIRVFPYNGQGANYTLTIDGDRGNNIAPPPIDDEFEENDSITSAALLAPGTFELSALDLDWFAIDGPGQIEVQIQGNGGDLDLALVDEEGNTLDASESPTSNETVSGTFTGRAYILVLPYNGQTADYQLTINMTTPVGPPEDGTPTPTPQPGPTPPESNPGEIIVTIPTNICGQGGAQFAGAMALGFVGISARRSRGRRRRRV